MSDQETKFVDELCRKFDEKYSRMQNFFIAILVVFVSAALIVGATQIASASATKRQVEINTGKIEYIMDNSASQKSIDMLVQSFENQTKTMEMYLPQDIQGAITHFNEVSGNFRSYILKYQSDLNVRGIKNDDK
jgi:TRAP-type C4-dicarboxylate transport system permease small subunit